MAKISFNVDFQKILNKNLSKYTYNAGINEKKNSRKKVLKNKNSLYNTPRGFAHKKSTKKTKTTNTEILGYFYNDFNFKLYEIAFSKKNPNYTNWVNSVQYIANEKPRRFENAISANIKACLDKQVVKRNKNTTALRKMFNRFGIDSRQLQQSFDAKRIE